MPAATISPWTVGSWLRFAKATAHRSRVVSSAARSRASATSAPSVPMAHRGRRQGSWADTALSTAQQDWRVAASLPSPHPAMTCGTAPSAMVTAEDPSWARRQSAAQQCFTISWSRVWSMSMNAGTTPSSTISPTFASTDASLQSVAAQRMRVRGSGSRDNAMMAGIADADTPRSRAASPRLKLKSASAHASRISDDAWEQSAMTDATPPWPSTCSWLPSSTNKFVSAERPWRSVDASDASWSSVTSAGTQPSWTMAWRPMACWLNKLSADAQSCVVDTSRGHRRQMLHSAVTPPSWTSRGRFWSSMARRMIADAM
mmetsp:Transcript_33929/g.115083  ORF Transcript_33929/g.115083 Transcript_33929/m.115083 type:complete len:316 (+) Transcript_33929:766-1713(+)